MFAGHSLPQIRQFSTGFPIFLSVSFPLKTLRNNFCRVDLFQEASAKHGGLAENEIFFFAPALAFGGAESIQYVEKGNAVVHQHLLFEMGTDNSSATKPDDMWSQAYEANPHVFELDNGGLMVSFILFGNCGYHLPTAPETLYEIEGETVSLWALTFFSLTRDENLGFFRISQGFAAAAALYSRNKRRLHINPRPESGGDGMCFIGEIE